MLLIEMMHIKMLLTQTFFIDFFLVKQLLNSMILIETMIIDMLLI